MESKNQQYNSYGIIDSPHSMTSVGGLDLSFKFDSKEYIYQFKYTCEDLEVCKFISDNYEKLCTLGVFNLSDIFSMSFSGDISSIKLSLIQRAFVLGIKDYIGYPGALLEQDSSVDSDIICFCAKVSKQSFIKSYNQNLGDEQKAVYETMVKSFCDECIENVDEAIKELRKNSAFFLGKTKEEWIDTINSLIEEFYLFCPPEYSNLEFNVKSLKFNKVIIACNKKDSTLNRVEIQKTLSNYLLSEIKEDVVISIVT